MADQPPYQAQPQQPPAKKGMSTCLIVGIVIAALAVPMIGVMAALAIHGTRRYLAAAKTSEAKNTIGAISRAAVVAYDREHESGKHWLCASAITVPTTVPAAVKYMPSSSDFATGSDTAGWRCLKFEMSMPMYYQYHYHQGSGWVAPEQAPGADGFEAAAVGDLDGNGVHSRFSRTGKVVGGEVRLTTNMFIDNEFE